MYIYIRAMSEHQSKIYDNITSKVGQIDRHIIRLCLYPHATQVNHWKTEVMSFLCDIDKQKNTKKYPKKSFILKALQVKNDMIDALRYQVEHIEKDSSVINEHTDSINTSYNIDETNQNNSNSNNDSLIGKKRNNEKDNNDEEENENDSNI